MKRYFIIAMIILVVVLTLSVSYNVFRKNYVRFPSWSMDPRYEILSVDENFITLSKPLQMTNSMFFPVDLYLGAIQVTDYEGKLIALINMTEQVKLEPHSVQDINLKVALPITLLNYTDFSQTSGINLFFDGTIQGGVYRIPFTKKISGTFNLTPDAEWSDKIFKPLLSKIMAQHNLIRFRGAKVISSRIVRLQFIASTFSNINVNIENAKLDVVYGNNKVSSEMKHSITLNSAMPNEVIEFDIKYSDWLMIRTHPKINFKGKMSLNVFGTKTEIDWTESIDGISNYLL